MKPNVVVVLPVAMPDFHLALKWLAWTARLAENHPNNYDLVVFPAFSLGAPEMLRLQLAVEGREGAVVIKNHIDYEHPELGYAAAANMMLKGALETVEKHYPGRPTLFCEADTTAIRPSWVDEIDAEYKAWGRPFMGDFHPSGEHSHMTGNAVYSANWRKDAPSLARLPMPRPQQGWDTLCAHETLPQSHRSCRIQQIFQPPPIIEKFMAMLHNETALFHRCKDGTLIDLLCARLGWPLIPLEKPLRSLTSDQVTGKAIPTDGHFKVEIFIVSCEKDIEFLRFCLKSLQMFAAGFSGITLAVPTAQKQLFGWVQGGIGGVKIITFDEQPGKGHLAQMIMKSRADELCPHADAIMFVDSDCMAWRPFALDDFVLDGKLLSVTELYEECGKYNHHRLNWQTTVEKATGLKPRHEFMVRHPQVHLSAVLRRTRELVEKHTGKSFDDYVLSGENKFPQTYCEFDTIGAVAESEYAAHYHFEPYDRAGDARSCGQDLNGSWQYIYRFNRDFLVECWSHGGIKRYEKLLNEILIGKPPQFVVK